METWSNRLSQHPAKVSVDLLACAFESRCLRQKGKQMKTNLYNEIVETLDVANLTIDDIRYVILNKHTINVERFLIASKEIDYEKGYGIEKISYDLKIIGDDWWIERYVYDGLEWFVFKTLPSPSKEEIFTTKEIKEMLIGEGREYCEWQ